jgi:hypothetical protein
LLQPFMRIEGRKGGLRPLFNGDALGLVRCVMCEFTLRTNGSLPIVARYVEPHATKPFRQSELAGARTRKIPVPPEKGAMLRSSPNIRRTKPTRGIVRGCDGLPPNRF